MCQLRYAVAEQPSDVTNVTKLLQAWNAGDQNALERLVPLVYAELGASPTISCVTRRPA